MQPVSLPAPTPFMIPPESTPLEKSETSPVASLPSLPASPASNEPEASPEPTSVVQAGAFAVSDTAVKLAAQLAGEFAGVEIRWVRSAKFGRLHKVWILVPRQGEALHVQAR